MAALDGKSALQIMQSVLPDLILLDINMPDIDGLSLLARCKADDDLKSIPIVMLTASRQEESVKNAIGAGAVHYIVKPFIPENVASRICQILSPFKPADNSWPHYKPKQKDKKNAVIRSPLEEEPICILFVNPFEANRFNANALKEKGYIIDNVPTAKEAIEALEKQDYPLLLIECELPDMNGYLLTHQIRYQDKQKKRYRIIIGLGDEPRSEKKWLSAGMNDYYSKPLSIGMLHRILVKYHPDIKEKYVTE